MVLQFKCRRQRWLIKTLTVLHAYVNMILEIWEWFGEP